MRCASKGTGISTVKASEMSETSVFLANDRVCRRARRGGDRGERARRSAAPRRRARGRARTRRWKSAAVARFARGDSRERPPRTGDRGKYLAEAALRGSAGRFLSRADAPAARRRRGRRTCSTRTSARRRGEERPRSWRSGTLSARLRETRVTRAVRTRAKSRCSKTRPGSRSGIGVGKLGKVCSSEGVSRIAGAARRAAAKPLSRFHRRLA